MPGFNLPKLNDLTLSILILQIIIYFVIYANMPVARMIICFAYLLFVPGIIILRIIKIKSFDFFDKVLFSTGLSIAFLMFSGLIINLIGRLVIINPLSHDLMIYCVNTELLFLTLINDVLHSSEPPYVKRDEIFNLLLPMLLCVSISFLGFYGIFVVNYSGNNLFILIFVILVSSLIAAIFVKNNVICVDYYPLLLLVIFMCSLFFVSTGYSLVTPYIIGLGDQWMELRAFRLMGGFWDPAVYFSNFEVGSTYSMASVTILPKMFSIFTGMDDSMIFKILFPMVVSFMAVGAYKLYKTQIQEDKIAFLATFFLITVSIGKGVGPSKQEIALLFYTLLFLLLLRKDISPFPKNFFMIIFGSALAISHYSLSFMFLFIIIVFLLILGLLKKVRTSSTNSYLMFTLFLSVISSTWYIFVNGSSVFNKFVDALSRVINNLDQFFNLSSRGTALKGLGFVPTPTFFHRISAALFILTEAFVFLGFIKLLVRKKQNPVFSIEYKILATVNITIIFLNIILPGLADTFLMQRFYQTGLIILAPLGVIGGEWVLKFVLNRRLQRAYTRILVLSVFIPLFLFQTEFVFELTNTNNQGWVIPLVIHRTDSTEMYRRLGCIDAYYFFGAKWVSQMVSSSPYTIIYTDELARRCELRAYASVDENQVRIISNVTELKEGDFVYLNPSNTIGGAVVGAIYSWNVTDFQFLSDANKIYCNGGSEIYKKQG